MYYTALFKNSKAGLVKRSKIQEILLTLFLYINSPLISVSVLLHDEVISVIFNFSSINSRSHGNKMSFKHISLDGVSLISHIMGFHGFHYLREIKLIIVERLGRPVTPVYFTYISHQAGPA